MKHILRDAQYGLRLLLRRPGFTIVAVVTLALGIGANTALFSVAHAVLLKPLPYTDPDRLVTVTENNLGRGWTSFSVAPANFVDWRAQSQSFASLAAYSSRALNSSGAGTPERLQGLAGTVGFYEMVDARPAVGRLFRLEEYEPGKNLVVLLSHGFWQRAFGGNPNVVDQTIVLNGQSYTIVGVLDESWRFGGRQSSVFTPYAMAPDEAQSRGGHYLSVLGRLKPGVSIDRAQAEMTALATRLDEAYPATNKGWGIVVKSLHEAAVGSVRPALVVLLGAVGLVLLVACANLANMHLARATVREREIAVRTAIGAGRGRIVQQLLTESVVLATVGGALGLALAWWAVSAFIAAYPNLVPRSGDVRVSPTVLAFSAGLSIVTALLFGLAPAISASRTDLVDSLKAAGRSGSGGRRWMRGALVVSEMALAVVLLVGAGLLIKSFTRLSHVNPGFETADRISARTILPNPKYADAGPKIDFYDRALERLRALPGVEAAALTSLLPISGSDELYSVQFEGRPPLPAGQGVSGIYYLVSPDYFKTMGIPVRKGRAFTDDDRDGTTRVAVVNETFVRLHYANEDPIGQRIRMGRNSNIVREIVGVVGNVKHYGLADTEQAQMYEPFRQFPTGGMTFVLKTAVEATTLAPAIRREIQGVDPDQPVIAVASVEQTVESSSALTRVQTLLLGVLAGLALLLASIGLYGVMAYSVSQRTQEIGVRMALGAHRPSVLMMILRQSLVLIGLGLAIGIAGAVALGRALSSALEPMLFQVTPSDVTTFVLVPVILAMVGILASLIPARRATLVDPIQALRNP
jgi:putative ABC transport system permease protein